MEVRVTKIDILSGYLSKFILLGANFITLPVILRMLSAEEVGMNYIMSSVGALVQIADFGFSAQIGRNITYVISGAQRIYKKDIEESTKENGLINFHLLASVIESAKYVYKRISIGILFILLTVGTLYMNHVTQGFSNVKNAFVIWITYSIGVFFNFYFLYYNSLLLGAGKIKEGNVAMVLSRIVYIGICFLLLFFNFGLLSIVTANIVAPFFSRGYAHYHFYSKEMKKNIENENISISEIKNTINTIWYTASRSGINMIGHFVGTQAGMFIAGFYLNLEDAAKWGLMSQLYTVLAGVSMSMFMSQMPMFAKFNIQGKKDLLIRKSSQCIVVFWAFSIVGSIMINCVVPIILPIIGSKTSLPSSWILWFYCLYILITNNAQIFACLLTCKNIIPSPKAVLATAFITIILMFICLHYFSMGIIGLIVSPFLAGITYTLWKWPQLVLRDFGLGYFAFLKRSFVFKG